MDNPNASRFRVSIIPYHVSGKLPNYVDRHNASRFHVSIIPFIKKYLFTVMIIYTECHHRITFRNVSAKDRVS